MSKVSDMFKIDWSEYESPITLNYVDDIMREVQKNGELAIMQAVNMYVDVDKDELLRALDYDRGQYAKGYKDGYEAARKEALGVLEKIAALAREKTEVRHE